MPLRSISNTATPLCMDYTYQFTKPIIIYCYTPFILAPSSVIVSTRVQLFMAKNKEKAICLSVVPKPKIFWGKTSRGGTVKFVRVRSAQRLGNYQENNLVFNLDENNIFANLESQWRMHQLLESTALLNR